MLEDVVSSVRTEEEAFVTVFPPLIWHIVLVVSTASCGSSRYTCDFSWPVYLRCLWESCRTDGAADWLFSLLLAGLHQLSAFYLLTLSIGAFSITGPCGTYSHSPARLARLPALPYLATVKFSENEKIVGRLLLPSSRGSCILISQNTRLTWQCQNKTFVWLDGVFNLSSFPESGLFFLSASISAHITLLLYLNIRWHRNRLCHVYKTVSSTAVGKEEMSCDKHGRKVTASSACEQIDLERNGVRGIEKMKERQRQVVSGTIQLSSQPVLNFPTFQNKETNFSQSSSGSHRKYHIIFPDSPGACNLYLPPFFKESSIGLWALWNSMT